MSEIKIDLNGMSLLDVIKAYPEQVLQAIEQHNKEAENTPTNTGSPKLPGVKKYLVWADKRQIRKTGHRLTQSDLDLLEAGYKFIARQLRAGA